MHARSNMAVHFVSAFCISMGTDVSGIGGREERVACRLLAGTAGWLRSLLPCAMNHKLWQLTDVTCASFMVVQRLPYSIIDGKPERHHS